MRATRTYLLCALGALVFAYVAPYVWDYVAIRAIGPRWQNAIVAGIGAIVGGVVAERIGWKGR
jgi:uncharacterized membrane protein YhiD involved in acid resistance